MSTPEIIRRKRDGQPLEPEDIAEFIRGVAENKVEDAQLGAFLMAVYLQGMTDGEQAALTRAMRDSGETLCWQALDGPVLDKHSTGGVGDLVSLVLAPLVAASGGFVPMISGRGLGHTGGTLDKLESIPGFDVNLSLDQLTHVVREAGFGMVGQGDALAPADQRMYAVRDVTATVDCQPLIVSSILSKKLCEGLDGLVMDVKIGNGAVMTDALRARQLGQALCDVSAAAGLACTALLTDMDQPLASRAGNALEIRSALEFLRGESGDTRLQEVVFALAAELLLTGNLQKERQGAMEQLQRALESGAAADRFARMVALQGGPGDLLEHPDRHLPRAPVIRPVPVDPGGYVAWEDTRAIGLIVRDLGGGRLRACDSVDPSVGLENLPAVGDHVASGEPLAIVHAANEHDADRAAQRLLDAVQLTEERPALGRPVVHDRLVPGSTPITPTE